MSSSTEVGSMKPNPYIFDIENRKKRRPRLAHDLGAGAKCNKCGDKCPGFELHFWRKICMNCRCGKDDHEVEDDDEDIGKIVIGKLFDRPARTEKEEQEYCHGNNLEMLNEETGKAENVKFDWVPPNVERTLASRYMELLPPDKRPIAGSEAAKARRRQLEQQVPLYDMDAAQRSDNLPPEELQHFLSYLERIRTQVAGQGSVQEISGLPAPSFAQPLQWQSTPKGGYPMNELGSGTEVGFGAGNLDANGNLGFIPDSHSDMGLSGQDQRNLNNANVQNNNVGIDGTIQTTNNPYNPLEQRRGSTMMPSLRQQFLGGMVGEPGGVPGLKPENTAFSTPYGGTRMNSRPLQSEKEIEGISSGLSDLNMQNKIPENMPGQNPTTISGIPPISPGKFSPSKTNSPAHMPFSGIPKGYRPVNPPHLQREGNQGRSPVKANDNITDINQQYNTPGYKPYQTEFEDVQRDGLLEQGDQKEVQSHDTNSHRRLHSPSGFQPRIPQSGVLHSESPAHVNQPDITGYKPIPSNVHQQSVYSPDKYGHLRHLPGQQGQPEYEQGLPEYVPGQVQSEHQTGQPEYQPHESGYHPRHPGQIGYPSGQVGYPSEEHGHPSGENVYQQRKPGYGLGQQGQINPQPGHRGYHSGEAGPELVQPDPVGYESGQMGYQEGKPEYPIGHHGVNPAHRELPVNSSPYSQSNNDEFPPPPYELLFSDRPSSEAPSIDSGVELYDNVGAKLKARLDNDGSRSPFPQMVATERNVAAIDAMQAPYGARIDTLSGGMYVAPGSDVNVLFPSESQVIGGHGKNKAAVVKGHKSKYTCQGCSLPMNVGDVAIFCERAGEDKCWHPACFSCFTCKELLADLIYFYKDGRVFCGRHFTESEEMPRCKACDELIFGNSWTRADGFDWHINHFCCNMCDTPMAGQRYVPDQNGYPYCLPCFMSCKAKMCEACEEKISPEVNRCGHRGYFYHATPECFKCHTCQDTLLGKRFKMSKNWVFCSNECIQKVAVELESNPNPKIKEEV